MQERLAHVLEQGSFPIACSSQVRPQNLGLCWGSAFVPCACQASFPRLYRRFVDIVGQTELGTEPQLARLKSVTQFLRFILSTVNNHESARDPFSGVTRPRLLARVARYHVSTIRVVCPHECLHRARSKWFVQTLPLRPATSAWLICFQIP